MGSFRLVAGSQHLHWRYSFTGSLAETAAKSLRHSCRSELTRQGISLSVVAFLGRNGCVVSVPLTSVRRRAARTISFSSVRWRSGVWPLRISSVEIDARPFLLVVCTDRIITHH